MKNNEFLVLLVTMILGGLTYSVVSFAYMHQTFTTVETLQKQEERLDRLDLRLEKRLIRIEVKLDKLLGGK